MEVPQVIDIGREAIWVLIKVSAPLMLTALIVGLAVSLLQALTQVQEMTLTFVPKILAMFLMLMLVMPFMVQELLDFGNELFTQITNSENSE